MVFFFFFFKFATVDLAQVVLMDILGGGGGGEKLWGLAEEQKLACGHKIKEGISAFLCLAPTLDMLSTGDVRVFS